MDDVSITDGVVADEPITLENPEMISLKEHKTEAENWQKRRHPEWTENYTLWRDRVVVNRLLQRQSVNVPLMKTVLKTAIIEIDDPPLLVFENLDNDKQKELFYNEYFEKFADDQKLTIKDIVDKKQEMLYGRPFKKLNIVNGKPTCENIDSWDCLATRYTDPTKFDGTRYFCQQHIFIPLSTLEQTPQYDQDVITKLKVYFATDRGLIKAGDNLKSLRTKNNRMQIMGVIDTFSPVIGETYVELSEHYLMQYDEDLGEDQYFLITTAEDREILMKRPLEEVMGTTIDHYWRTHIPYITWASDVELTDIWSDGLADIVRVPNKIANTWISQMIENRTLRNFSMYFFDSSIEGFTPQTYEPVPFGWYPSPGNPQQTIQQIQIPDLGSSLQELEFVMNMAENAVGTPDISQGIVNKKTMTKAEMQAMLQQAQTKVKSTSIYYNDAWKEFGTKFIKMIEGGHDLLAPIKIFKKGYKGTMFSKNISPNDWKTKSGYGVKVMTKDEKDKEEKMAIEKLNSISPDFQNNPAFQNIRKKKELAYAGLNPDEIKEVLDAEKQQQQALQQQAQQQQSGNQSNGQVQPPQQTQQPQLSAQAAQ